MGGQVAYVPCPSSPTGSMAVKMPNRKTVVICGIFQAIAWIVAIVFLVLYVLLLRSVPAVQLAECQSELQNQSSQAQARITSLGQRVEAMEKEKAKSEERRDGLWTQLAKANQSVAKMYDRWDACQNQLKSLEKNITSEVAETTQGEAKKCEAVEEEVKLLRQQLKDAQNRNQQYRRENEAQQEKYQANIQQLQDKLKNQQSKSSGAGALQSPITALFLPIFGGLFFFLFL